MKLKILINLYIFVFSIAAWLMEKIEACPDKNGMLNELVIPYMETWINANKP
jgi:hypothetical protein